MGRLTMDLEGNVKVPFINLVYKYLQLFIILYVRNATIASVFLPISSDGVSCPTSTAIPFDLP